MSLQQESIQPIHSPKTIKVAKSVALTAVLLRIQKALQLFKTFSQWHSITSQKTGTITVKCLWQNVLVSTSTTTPPPPNSQAQTSENLYAAQFTEVHMMMDKICMNVKMIMWRNRNAFTLYVTIFSLAYFGIRTALK